MLTTTIDAFEKTVPNAQPFGAFVGSYSENPLPGVKNFNHPGVGMSKVSLKENPNYSGVETSSPSEKVNFSALLSKRHSII